MLPVVHCCVECSYLSVSRFLLENYTFSIRRCMFTNFQEIIYNFTNVLQKISASRKIHHMPPNLIINILGCVY